MRATPQRGTKGRSHKRRKEAKAKTESQRPEVREPQRQEEEKIAVTRTWRYQCWKCRSRHNPSCRPKKSHGTVKSKDEQNHATSDQREKPREKWAPRKWRQDNERNWRKRNETIMLREKRSNKRNRIEPARSPKTSQLNENETTVMKSRTCRKNVPRETCRENRTRTS